MLPVSIQLHTKKTLSLLRQMQLVGIMQITSPTLCINHLESKSRLVALFQLHVSFLIRKDHLMLQIPTSTSTEFCNYDIAVAEEVNVKIGVRTRL